MGTLEFGFQSGECSRLVILLRAALAERSQRLIVPNLLPGDSNRMRTIALLTVSNIFMTFAWYGHLKYRSEALWKVVLASWSVAFFEYGF